MKNYIQFRKQRELGEILNDTFAFIREEWRTLFGLIFRLAGPALLLVVAAYVYYMQTTLGSIGGLGANPYMDSPEMFGMSLILAVLVLLIAAVVYYSLLYGTVLSYIKSYIINNGNVDVQQVKDQTRKDFWSLTGLNFLNGIIIVFGAILCFFPGIYLGIVLATSFSILMFERKAPTDAISASFNLIKGEWWITFATLLVMGILYYLILIIFQIPQYIYFFIQGLTMSQEIGSDPTQMFDWVYVALSSIGVIAQYLLQTFLVISTAFVYFNLNEKKNFTGTLEQIDSIGQRDETNV